MQNVYTQPPNWSALFSCGQSTNFDHTSQPSPSKYSIYRPLCAAIAMNNEDRHCLTTLVVICPRGLWLYSQTPARTREGTCRRPEPASSVSCPSWRSNLLVTDPPVRNQGLSQGQRAQWHHPPGRRKHVWSHFHWAQEESAFLFSFNLITAIYCKSN